MNEDNTFKELKESDFDMLMISDEYEINSKRKSEYDFVSNKWKTLYSQ